MKSAILIISISFFMFLSNVVRAAEDNVHFSGVLITQPCTIPDSDMNIEVDFGSVILSYLYKYQRTMSQSFMIHLENCDASLMHEVSLQFQGAADNELPDLLQIDSTSSATGIAIGLQLSNGTKLGINKYAPWSELVDGNNTLSFGAYVQAQPTSLSRKMLKAGDFTATSAFVLNYQ